MKYTVVIPGFASFRRAYLKKHRGWHLWQEAVRDGYRGPGDVHVQAPLSRKHTYTAYTFIAKNQPDKLEAVRKWLVAIEKAIANYKREIKEKALLPDFKSR